MRLKKKGITPTSSGVLTDPNREDRDVFDSPWSIFPADCVGPPFDIPISSYSISLGPPPSGHLDNPTPFLRSHVKLVPPIRRSPVSIPESLLSRISSPISLEGLGMAPVLSSYRQDTKDTDTRHGGLETLRHPSPSGRTEEKRKRGERDRTKEGRRCRRPTTLTVQYRPPFVILPLSTLERGQVG